MEVRHDGNGERIWAIGKKPYVSEAPGPERGKAREEVEMVRKEQDRLIRYEKHGIIPIMESTPSILPEELDGRDPRELKVTPLRDPVPITTPFWLDPARYGPLDEYTPLEISWARQRGYEYIALGKGYTTGSINADSSSRRALIEETPQIVSDVEKIMAKHIAGYRANA